MVSFLCPTTAQWLCIAAVLGFGYQPALNRMGKDCFFGVYGSGRDFKLTHYPSTYPAELQSVLKTVSRLCP